MFAIEAYVPGAASPTRNPNDHQSGDTLDALNLGFHAEVTRGIVAAVATLSAE